MELFWQFLGQAKDWKYGKDWNKDGIEFKAFI